MFFKIHREKVIWVGILHFLSLLLALELPRRGFLIQKPKCLALETSARSLELTTLFWRKDCNGRRRALKRSSIASRRTRIYEKRLTTFGDIAWNVKKLFGVQNVVVLLENTHFLLNLQLHGKRKTRHFLENNYLLVSEKNCTFHAVSPKVVSLFS